LRTGITAFNAALRRDGAIAMLGDLRSGGSGDQCGGGGDVQRATRIAARATGVHKLGALRLREWKHVRGVTQRQGEACDFFCRFAARRHSAEQCCKLDLARLAGKNTLHQRAAFVERERDADFEDAAKFVADRHASFSLPECCGETVSAQARR
jgi:hypothetical protein